MLNSYYSNTPKSWREELNDIKTAREEYLKYSGIMSEFEKMSINKAVGEERAKLEPKIIEGAISEFYQAARNVISKQNNLKAELSKETARWDAAKLASEMQLTQMLAENALKSPSNRPGEDIERLTKIYNDAQNSGDIYKQRAAAEVFVSIVSTIGGNDMEKRMTANTLANRAVRDAQTIRYTEGIKAAEVSVNEATDGLNRAKMTLWDVDRDLGYTRPNGNLGYSELIRAIQKVEQDELGNISIKD